MGKTCFQGWTHSRGKTGQLLSAWHSHSREYHGATVAGLRAETLEPFGFKSWL